MDIEGKAESKLVQIELKASLLVTNENRDGVQAQVGIAPARRKTAAVRLMLGGMSGHQQIIYNSGAQNYYKAIRLPAGASARASAGIDIREDIIVLGCW